MSDTVPVVKKITRTRKTTTTADTPSATTSRVLPDHEESFTVLINNILKVKTSFVQLHKEIKIGTLKSILRQAGVSEKDFLGK